MQQALRITMKYVCPVCGYDNLSEPPENHLICPCCGTEFDYHDCSRSHGDLRRRWIQQGVRWHSRYTPAPKGWNAATQLYKANMLSLTTSSGVSSGDTEVAIPEFLPAYSEDAEQYVHFIAA